MTEEKSFLTYLFGAIMVAILFVALVGCANNQKERDHYKILWGKRCTESGNQYSYVWFHTTTGPDQVKKEWCNVNSK